MFEELLSSSSSGFCIPSDGLVDSVKSDSSSLSFEESLGVVVSESLSLLLSSAIASSLSTMFEELLSSSSSGFCIPSDGLVDSVKSDSSSLSFGGSLGVVVSDSSFLLFSSAIASSLSPMFEESLSSSGFCISSDVEPFSGKEESILSCDSLVSDSFLLSLSEFNKSSCTVPS